MDIDERQDRIAEVVWAQKKIKAGTLSKMFDVSAETIRKDLLDLHTQGRITKVHGGAQVPTHARESAYDRRRLTNTEDKVAMARHAAAEINEESTIFLDYGTTTLALAKAVQQRQIPLTVITASMPIVHALADSDEIDVIVLGGMLRKNERALCGPLAEESLSSLHMDQGFFGCAGVHVEAGITNPNMLEVAVSRKALLHCAASVILADGSKLNAIAVHKVADLTEIDTLVTTQHPDAALVGKLDESGVSLAIPTKENHALS